MNIKLCILLFLTFFFHQNGFSQLDSISGAKLDPWYTPTADGTEYKIDIPTLDKVISYFQKVDATKVDDTDRIKMRHYTETFIYYLYPKGNKSKDEKVSKLIDLLINHNDLHLAYPKVFIKFFYKNHQYFNEEQRQRISRALIKPIGSNFENYYRVINLYQIKEFSKNIESLLGDSVIFKIKNSFLNRDSLFKDYGNLKRISVLANLDTAYQNILLALIRDQYNLVNNPENELSQNMITDLKMHLYGKIIKESLNNLADKKEIVTRTLYLLNETYVLSHHADQPRFDFAYTYYQYMILPLLAKNRLAMDEFLKNGGNDEVYFRSLFEKYRTPELMRAALIEFGILER